MMYIAEKAFFFKSLTLGLQVFSLFFFFLPCFCIREEAQKLICKVWLKTELSCQGYSKFSLLAIFWGDLLSQALSCARAACQLLGSLAGKRVEKPGALRVSARVCCKSQPLVIKPSVLLNILVVFLCACVVCPSTQLREIRFSPAHSLSNVSLLSGGHACIYHS